MPRSTTNGGAPPAIRHLRYVERLVETVPAGGEVLGAACGTGKYWPQLLAAGCRLLGIDQSGGMLA